MSSHPSHELACLLYVDPGRGSEAHACLGHHQFRNPAAYSLSDFLSPLSHRWIGVMRNGIDAISPDEAMQRDYNPLMAFYFIAFMLVGHLFVVNLFVGIILDNFTQVSLDPPMCALTGSFTDGNQAQLGFRKLCDGQTELRTGG